MVACRIALARVVASPRARLRGRACALYVPHAAAGRRHLGYRRIPGHRPGAGYRPPDRLSHLHTAGLAGLGAPPAVRQRGLSSRPALGPADGWAAALLAVRVVQATRRWALGVWRASCSRVTPVAWRMAPEPTPTRCTCSWRRCCWSARRLVAGRARHEAASRRARRSAGSLAGCVVFGLSLGNHALTLLLAPGIATFVLLVEPRILWRSGGCVLACLAALAAHDGPRLRLPADPLGDGATTRLRRAETWQWLLVRRAGRAVPGLVPGVAAARTSLAGVWDELVRNLGALVMLVPAGAVLGVVRHPRLTVLGRSGSSAPGCSRWATPTRPSSATTWCRCSSPLWVSTRRGHRSGTRSATCCIGRDGAGGTGSRAAPSSCVLVLLAR